jgi:hypothetical protein
MVIEPVAVEVPSRQRRAEAVIALADVADARLLLAPELVVKWVVTVEAIG